MQDSTGLFDPAPNTFSFIVNPLSNTPAVGDDKATTPEDTPVTIDVLANDSDADPQDVLTIVAVNDTPITVGGTPVPVTDPNGEPVGTVSLTPDNQAGVHPGPRTTTARPNSPTPPPTACTPVKGTVEVAVTPVNDPPAANPDVINTPEGTPGHHPGAGERHRSGRRPADHHLGQQHPHQSWAHP